MNYHAAMMRGEDMSEMMKSRKRKSEDVTETLKIQVENQKEEIHNLKKEHYKIHHSTMEVVHLQNQLIAGQSESIETLQKNQKHTNETLEIMYGIITDLTEYKKQKSPIPTASSSQSDIS